MTQTHRDILLATERSETQSTARQLTSYREHRRRLIGWMLDRDKSPDRGRGYATSTTKIRAYRLDMFYCAVWDAEDRCTERITTDHADTWLEHLDAPGFDVVFDRSTTCDM